MILVFNCPECRKEYEIDGKLAGRKSRCGQCGTTFRIPVPSGGAGPVLSAPASPASPPPRPASTSVPRTPSPSPARPASRPLDAPPNEFWEEVDDKVEFWDAEDDASPAAFKSAPKPVSVYDDEVLPAPPRVQPLVEASKSKNKKKKSSSYDDDSSLWTRVATGYAIFFMATMGFVALTVTTDLYSYQLMRWALVANVALFLVATVVCGIAGFVGTVVYPFGESLSCGLCYIFIPFYAIYYIFTRWDDMKKPVSLYAASVVCMSISGPVFTWAAGLMREQNARMAGVARGPQVPGMPAPAMPPGPGGGFLPGVPPEFDQTRGRIGDTSVKLVIEGIPTNLDPNVGLTGEEVRRAIVARVGQAQPQINGWIWGQRNGGSPSLRMIPEPDAAALANSINFGRVTRQGNTINVTLDQDFLAAVPRIPKNELAQAQPPPAPAPDNFGGKNEPQIPANADPVTRSLLELKNAGNDHFKKVRALERLRRTKSVDRASEVVQAVVLFLTDDDSSVAAEAAKTLGFWPGQETVQALLDRLDDDRSGVRHEAIRALGKIRDPRTVEPLLARLSHNQFEVEDAIKDIGELAEPALIVHLKDPEIEQRRFACKMLKRVGGMDTLVAMQSMSPDPDRGVQMEARETWKAIVSRVGAPPPLTKKKKR